MSVLLRHRFIAALAPVSVPNCDIVVTDDIGDPLCAIQVKTRVEKGSDGGWHMSEKHETISSPGLFYVFLDFGRTLTDPPRRLRIPRENEVARRADVICIGHSRIGRWQLGQDLAPAIEVCYEWRRHFSAWQQSDDPASKGGF